jgi:malate dehydrogenase
MREVAIIGAGELGGALAYLLARHDVVRTIRLVDEAGTIASGKALDIAQAAPVERFATQMVGTTDLASAAGANVIVVADRAGGGDSTDDELAQRLKRLTQMAPHAVVVCAGAGHRAGLDRAIRELALPRTRVLGSAPEALAAGARALIALAVDGSPRDVSVSVLGVPPAHTVVTWQDATIAGVAATRAIDEPTRRRLTSRITALWPPGPYSLAAAAVAALDSISGRSRRQVCCFVGPDTSSGTRTRTAALPVRLGRSGIVEVVSTTLSVVEQVALDSAMAL